MNYYAQNNKGYGQPNTNTRALVLYSDISQLIVTYWNDKISMKICNIVPESLQEGQVRRYNENGVTFALSSSKIMAVLDKMSALLIREIQGFVIETGTPGNTNEVNVMIDESGDIILTCTKTSTGASASYKFNKQEIKEIQDDGTIVSTLLDAEFNALRKVLENFLGNLYSVPHAISYNNQYKNKPQQPQYYNNNNGVYNQYQQPQQAPISNISSTDDLFSMNMNTGEFDNSVPF